MGNQQSKTSGRPAEHDPRADRLARAFAQTTLHDMEVAEKNEKKHALGGGPARQPGGVSVSRMEAWQDHALKDPKNRSGPPDVCANGSAICILTPSASP
jgi:hypothetical protein